MEAFNSWIRRKCLNASWILSMTDAHRWIDDWRVDHSENRPKSALGNLMTSACAAELRPSREGACSPDHKQGEVPVL
ncbi:MAG: transposase [Rhodobacteraceae bacterium]|nr:transposase [Paracoccaceae bacterium]